MDTSTEFSVKELRQALEDHHMLLSGPYKETFWPITIPKKINIFAWRMERDRLPVLLNLSDKGIEVESVLCPRCGDKVESISHAIFECSKLAVVWSGFFKWWGLIPNFQVDNNLIKNEPPSELPRNHHCLWKSSLITVAYFVWRDRNEGVFKCKKGAADNILGTAQLMLFSWIKSRIKSKQNFSWTAWWCEPWEIAKLVH